MKNSSSSSPISSIISRKPLRVQFRKMREEVRAKARTMRAAADHQPSQSVRSEEEVLAPVPEEPQTLQFPSNPDLELDKNEVVNAEEVLDPIPDEPKTPQSPTKPKVEVDDKVVVKAEAKTESQESEGGGCEVVKAKIKFDLNLPPPDEEIDDEEAGNN